MCCGAFLDMEKDKRYLVFSYDTYHPEGGLVDMKESFDTIPEAIEFIKKDRYDYKELYDRVNGVEIELSNYGIV